MTFTDLVIALDHPLCLSLAPEVHALRPLVVAHLQRFSKGCKPCQAKSKAIAEAELEIKLANLLLTNPQLAEAFARIVATSKTTP